MRAPQRSRKNLIARRPNAPKEIARHEPAPTGSRAVDVEVEVGKGHAWIVPTRARLDGRGARAAPTRQAGWGSRDGWGPR
jgi:hypothetical protein